MTISQFRMAFDLGSTVPLGSVPAGKNCLQGRHGFPLQRSPRAAGAMGAGQQRGVPHRATFSVSMSAAVRNALGGGVVASGVVAHCPAPPTMSAASMLPPHSAA